MNDFIRIPAGAMKNFIEGAKGIANDTANINSIGHHGSYAKYVASFSSNLKQAASQGGAGGGASIAASNMGSGMELAGMSTSFAQGAIETTGIDEHLAIEGEGSFFKVKDVTGNRLFVTRAGDFRFDGDHLVNTRGYRLQGLSAGSAIFKVTGNDPNNLSFTIDTTNEANLTAPAVSGDISKDFTVSVANGTIDRADIAPEITNEQIDAKKPLVTDVSISPDGKVSLNFDTGHSVTVAQILLMKFENPSMLKNGGNGLYVEFEKAQPIDFNGVWGAIPRSPGVGVLRPGNLELSNVDITDKFANMVATQRYFQINAKAFHAADEYMQEIVNLV